MSSNNNPDSAKNAKDKAQKIFSMAVWPLTLYSAAGAYYMYNSKFSLFSYHPFLMVFSFITLAGNSILIKKIGGYDNTKKHGFSMLAACAAALGGWYAIYANKNKFGKPHLMSLHGKLGAAVIIAYLALGVGGAVALNPDWGIMRTNKSFRTIHKWVGRLLTAASWYVCVLGFDHMQKDVTMRAITEVPLLLLGLYVLL